MVHGFAKQSGGHLDIQSELGHGTAIHVFLPYTAELEGADTDKPDVKSPVQKGAEIILVVEHDARVLKTTVNRLSHLGYSVLQAEAGQRALDMLAENSCVDLVFTDMVMRGGMTGAELVEKAKKLYPHIKFISTSGYTDGNAIPSEGALWLRKPFRLEEMSWVLRQLLDGKKAEFL